METEIHLPKRTREGNAAPDLVHTPVSGGGCLTPRHFVVYLPDRAFFDAWRDRLEDACEWCDGLSDQSGLKGVRGVRELGQRWGCWLRLEGGWKAVDRGEFYKWLHGGQKETRERR